MSGLPQRRIFAFLADLLMPLEDGRFIHQGWSPQCEQFPSENDDVWGVLKTTAIQDGKFLPQHNKTLPLALEPRPLLEVHPGDLLLTCAGPRIRCGVPCLVRTTRPRLLISGKMYRMQVRQPAVNSRFVEAMLRAPETQKAIDAMKTGMSESGMNLTHERFAQLTIPFPSSNEQKRIADKLDTVLARVDACRDRLNSVPVILKRFRQAVLTAATSGTLTEEWRGEAHGTTTWQSGTLESLIVGKPRNGYSPRAVEYKTPVKSLTLSATTSGRFLPHHYKYIDENIPRSSHLWLQPGDILLQRANTLEYLGVSVVYEGASFEFIYPDLMMKCRANDRVLPNFLHYLLLSEPVRRYFRENATGTAGNMPKINQQTVISTPVSWPCIDEQCEIVRRAEALFSYADRLEASYTTARAQVDRLTPALLAKAFRGEMVEQDPNDAPASELLAHLQAARAEEAAKPKKHKTLRRAKVKTTITEEAVKAIIARLPTPSFSFDDLRSQVSGDYETLKDVVFNLLTDPTSGITQVFDVQMSEMRFQRTRP